MNELVEKLRSIEDVVKKNDDLRREADRLRSEHSVKKPEQLEEDFQTIMREGRLLKLGIIGRVKAGKSSLLNALFFQGKSVLPKAATPMTAALTVLTHAEERGLEVDYYSEDDQHEIKKTAAEYEDALRKETDKILNELVERDAKKKRNTPQAELEERAERQAKKDLVDIMSVQKAAWQQYDGMKKRGSPPQSRGREPFSDSARMNERLKELVSAEGAEMPFTKSVTLYLPEDQLRDVEIIDTPGTNDPVVSREQRTRDLLATCDVVFVVATAGQFLSAEDMELMNLIQSKDGVQEFYLVATQVDNQLYASEKEEAGGRLADVLERVRGNLAAHAQTVIREWNVIGSESIKERMLELGTERLFCTASIGYGLAENLENQNTWDENEHKVWNNLCRHYPDNFSDTDIGTSKASLNLLTGIEPIRAAFDDVRRRKDDIVEEKRQERAKTEERKIMDFQEGLKKSIEENIKTVQNNELDDLRNQKQDMEEGISRIRNEIDEKYCSLVDELCVNLPKAIIRDYDKLFSRTQENTDREKGTAQVQDIIVKRWLFFKRNITELRDEFTVNTPNIYSNLERLYSGIKAILRDRIHEKVTEWKKETHTEFFGILKECLTIRNLDGKTPDTETINAHTASVKLALRSMILSVNPPEIQFDKLPQELEQTKILKDSEAEEYMQVLSKFLTEFRHKTERDIESYSKTLHERLNKLEFSKDFLINFNKQLQHLSEEISKKEIVIERYKRALMELESA